MTLFQNIIIIITIVIMITIINIWRHLFQNGDTALHIAAAMGRRKLTKILLESGCDAESKNKQGETSMEISRRKNLVDIINILQNPPPLLSQEDRQDQVWHVFTKFAFSLLDSFSDKNVPVTMFDTESQADNAVRAKGEKKREKTSTSSKENFEQNNNNNGTKREKKRVSSPTIAEESHQPGKAE